MTIEEIERLLPNGFHDSTILSVRLNYEQRTAEIDMEIWVAGPVDEDPEQYRRSTLLIFDLVYFVIEPPGPPNASHAAPSLVDGGSTDLERSAYPLPKPLPAGAFTYWFFVSNWNSFIHVAALHAELAVPPLARKDQSDS
jgi:hypothetical protein